MKKDEIHIDEENIQFFWGLAALVSIALATYLLFNAFMAGSWHVAGLKQIGSLLLLVIGFYGIIRISTPLFHFVLRTTDDLLTIEIWQEGDEPLDVKKIMLNNISELRIAPHERRSAHEALFDFSTSYHLLYRCKKRDVFENLISLEDETFTLKVSDIGRIMRFIISHNSAISVPENEAVMVHPDNLNLLKIEEHHH